MSQHAIHRALRHPDRLGAGAARRRRLSSKGAKAHAVMAEFKRGTLRSGSGSHVKNRKQAIAIALSESGQSRPRGSSAMRRFRV